MSTHIHSEIYRIITEIWHFFDGSKIGQHLKMALGYYLCYGEGAGNSHPKFFINLVKLYIIAKNQFYDKQPFSFSLPWGNGMASCVHE